MRGTHGKEPGAVMRPVAEDTIDGSRSLTDERKSDPEIIIESKEIRDVLVLATKAAAVDVTVLLEGESGVGKEVFARYIHEKSHRAPEPFIPVDCGAIPETLFEAEFFGYDKGAFTNAFTAHRGYFEQANRGTILLDEISEMPLTFQGKLLRVVEDKQVVRLGAEKRIQLDTRVIATSQHNLLSLAKRGKFRHDLYYRVAVWVIPIPPLRERKGDIELLAQHFLKKHGSDGQGLSSEALRKLSQYDWPGNVRELESCIIRSLLHTDGKGYVGPDDIHFEAQHCYKGETQNTELEEALRISQGKIKQAADLGSTSKYDI